MRKLVVSLGFVAFALATNSFAVLGCSAGEGAKFIPPGDGEYGGGEGSSANPNNASTGGGSDGGAAVDTGPVLPPLPQYSLLLDGTCTGAGCDALTECIAPAAGGTLIGSKCFSSDGQCKGPANGDALRNVYGCYDTGIPIWAIDSKCGGIGGLDGIKVLGDQGACTNTAGIAPCEIEGGNEVLGSVCGAPGTRCTLNQTIYACLPSATTNVLSELCEDQTAGNCSGLGLCATPTPGGSLCTTEGKRCVVADDLPTAGATSTAGRAYTCIRR